jgi:3-isopropylmalate dehydrogenase
MKLNLLVVAGDGIGPEVTREAVSVLQTVAERERPRNRRHRKAHRRHRHRHRRHPAARRHPRSRTRLRRRLSRRSRRHQVERPAPQHPPRSRPLQAALSLGGFANLRPAFAIKSSPSTARSTEVIEGADILFVRELLGGLYFGSPREWNKRPAKPGTPCATPATKSSALPASPSSSPKAQQKAHLRRQGQRP